MIEKLKGIVPDSIFLELPAVANQYAINTPLRMAHFLSQTAHESADFTKFVENLNYSEQGLLKTFPKYFNATTAKSYARKPTAIANKVYANRMGNGNEASGDGWKYRGRGAIQLTGKANYAAFDNAVADDILANPDLVATKYPLLSAAWWWMKNGVNAIADNGSVESVTKKVNGGLNGLHERAHKFEYYLLVLK